LINTVWTQTSGFSLDQVPQYQCAIGGDKALLPVTPTDPPPPNEGRMLRCLPATCGSGSQGSGSFLSPAIRRDQLKMYSSGEGRLDISNCAATMFVKNSLGVGRGSIYGGLLLEDDYEFDLDSNTNTDASEEIPSNYLLSGQQPNPSPFFREKRIGDSCEISCLPGFEQTATRSFQCTGISTTPGNPWSTMGVATAGSNDYNLGYMGARATPLTAWVFRPESALSSAASSTSSSASGPSFTSSPSLDTADFWRTSTKDLTDFSAAGGVLAGTSSKQTSSVANPEEFIHLDHGDEWLEIAGEHAIPDSVSDSDAPYLNSVAVVGAEESKSRINAYWDTPQDWPNPTDPAIFTTPGQNPQTPYLVGALFVKL